VVALMACDSENYGASMARIKEKTRVGLDRKAPYMLAK